MTITRIHNAPALGYGWQSEAACRGVPQELFVGPDDEQFRDRVRREASAVTWCVGCPVVQACLDHALRVPEHHGVWGATTPEQRMRMRIRTPNGQGYRSLEPPLNPVVESALSTPRRLLDAQAS